jgi:hypothetical protein
MIKKWKIIAAILASSFILTEASKSVHFLFFHHEAEHHDSCSSSDCLDEEEAICIFEHVQFFPFESDTGTLQLANEEKVIILPEVLPEKVEQKRIKAYLLRGPPSSAPSHQFQA